MLLATECRLSSELERLIPSPAVDFERAGAHDVTRRSQSPGLFLYIEAQIWRDYRNSVPTNQALQASKHVRIIATMYYLIHTAAHTRPFLTTLSFIAQDFRDWGFRVDCHLHESRYIAEIRLRERIINRTEWRVELMEIWAREVISRKMQEREQGCQTQAVQPSSDASLSQEERRIARASSVAQDFVDGIAAFGECGCEIHKYFLMSSSSADRPDKPGTIHTPFQLDPRPIPPGPTGLISKCMRLLAATRYTKGATLPAWSNPDILIADQITLEFRFHEALRKEHLVHAVSRAISKNLGRMGRVERDTLTGNTKVVLFVDVSDCVVPQGGGGGGDEETRDPVPVYERGEGPPPYM